MNQAHTLLGCLLIAALAVLPAGAAWSAPQSKKQPKKVSVLTQKKKARVAGPKNMAPKVASAALALAAPMAAANAQDLASASAGQVVVASVSTTAGLPAEVAAATPAEPQPAPQVVAAPAPANPYLSSYQQVVAPLNPLKTLGEAFDSVKMSLPHLPLEGQAILPRIQKVYPTGEKPLVVLTFKCPTEVVGITPLPTKALHELVNLGFDGVNRSNLLSFNLQQVCQ